MRIDIIIQNIDLQISLGKYPNRLDCFQTPVKQEVKYKLNDQFSTYQNKVSDQRALKPAHTKQVFAFPNAVFLSKQALD